MRKKEEFYINLDKEIDLYYKKCGRELEEVIIPAIYVDYLIDTCEDVNMLSFPLKYRGIQVKVCGVSKYWYINKLKEQEKDIKYLKNIIKDLKEKINSYSDLIEEL